MTTNMSPVNPAKKTLSDLLRGVFKKFLDRSAALLDRLGVTPNLITLLGLFGTMAASYFVYRGHLLAAAIIAAAASAMDAFDGSLARYQGIKSPFGAFLDSTLDRYSEGALLLGCGAYFMVKDQPGMILVTATAIFGSMLVSYSRARGEAVGYTVKCGLFTRLERTIVMILSLAAGFPGIGVILIALFANVTALQRILTVVRQEQEQNQEEG